VDVAIVKVEVRCFRRLDEETRRAREQALKVRASDYADCADIDAHEDDKHIHNNNHLAIWSRLISPPTYSFMLGLKGQATRICQFFCPQVRKKV
jgi:hypothetical protein